MLFLQPPINTAIPLATLEKAPIYCSVKSGQVFFEADIMLKQEAQLIVLHEVKPSYLILVSIIQVAGVHTSKANYGSVITVCLSNSCCLSLSFTSSTCRFLCIIIMFLKEKEKMWPYWSRLK